MINPIPKTGRTRLTGVKLKQLHDYIHWRDNFTCIIPGCGNWVEEGEKAHHEPCGRYKEDVEEKMCLLCYEHHQQRESIKGEPIKQACIDYLDRLYPDRRDRFNIPA
jgi:hypothetical protein